MPFKIPLKSGRLLWHHWQNSPLRGARSCLLPPPLAYSLLYEVFPFNAFRLPVSFCENEPFFRWPTPLLCLIFWVALLTITAIGNIFWVLLQLPTFLRYIVIGNTKTQLKKPRRSGTMYSTIGWNPLSVLHPYFIANIFFSYSKLSGSEAKTKIFGPKSTYSKKNYYTLRIQPFEISTKCQNLTFKVNFPCQLDILN